jgi:hypothetical protein
VLDSLFFFRYGSPAILPEVLMYGFVSGMSVAFDPTKIVLSERGEKYFDVSMTAPWGLVYQRVRRDRILDKNRKRMFEDETPVAAT